MASYVESTNGVKFAVDTADASNSNSHTSRCVLVFGPDGGPYTRVTSAAGLPVEIVAGGGGGGGSVTQYEEGDSLSLPGTGVIIGGEDHSSNNFVGSVFSATGQSINSSISSGYYSLVANSICYLQEASSGDFRPATLSDLGSGVITQNVTLVNGGGFVAEVTGLPASCNSMALTVRDAPSYLEQQETLDLSTEDDLAFESLEIRGYDYVAMYGNNFSGATLVAEASVDGSLWTILPCYTPGTGGDVSVYDSLPLEQVCYCNINGMKYFRVRVSSTDSGNSTVEARFSRGNIPCKIPVSISLPYYNQPGINVRQVPQDYFVSGSIDMTDIERNVIAYNIHGMNTAVISISGTFTGNLKARGTVDGTNYFGLAAINKNENNGWLDQGNDSTSLAGLYYANISGMRHFKIQVTLVGTGTADVSIRCSQAVSPYFQQMLYNDGDNNLVSPTADGDGCTKVRVESLSGTISVNGVFGHDTADNANPVKIGSRAIGYGTTPAEVSANDLVNRIASQHGISYVQGGHPNIITTEFEYTSAQTNTAMVLVGGTQRICVTEINFTATNANTANIDVRIGFATSTLPAKTATAPGTAKIILSHPGVAPGSGMTRGDGTSVIGFGGLDEDLRITTTGAGTVRAVVSYFLVTG